MQLYKNDRQRYMAGLLYIFMIYSIYILIFQEHVLFGKFKLPVIQNRIVMFVFAGLIYLVGTVHLGKLQQSWMLLLWHLVYIGFLSIFLVIILIKLILLNISCQIGPIHISDTIKELLISPMLYFSLGLLNRLLVKKQQPV